MLRHNFGFFRGCSGRDFASTRTISAGLVALGGAADRRRVKIICVAYSLKFCHLHIKITCINTRNAFQQILRFLKSHSWPNRMERFENLDVLKSIISDPTANPWQSSLPFVASHFPQVFPPLPSPSSTICSVFERPSVCGADHGYPPPNTVIFTWAKPHKSWLMDARLCRPDILRPASKSPPRPRISNRFPGPSHLSNPTIPPPLLHEIRLSSQLNCNIDCAKHLRTAWNPDFVGDWLGYEIFCKRL